MASDVRSCARALLIVVSAAAGCHASSGDCTTSLSFPPATPVPAPLSGVFVRDAALEQRITAADTAGYSRTDDFDFSSALVADFSGDGRSDLLYNRSLFGSHLFVQGQAGDFQYQDVPDQRPGAAGFGPCPLAADLDADGSPDVLCTGSAPRIYWGGAAGIDWTVNTRLMKGDYFPMAAVAWDLDEDGLLDLVISPWGPPKVVLRNRGGRTFEDVGGAWGLDAVGQTWQTGFVDFDGDRRFDVYVSNDGSGKDNQAFRALGPGAGGEPRFERIHPMADGCDERGFFDIGGANPMGFALGDLEASGPLVMYLALLTGNDAMLTPRGGVWKDAYRALAIPDAKTTTGAALIHWSPIFWDVNRDGLLDLLLPGGDDAGHATQAGRGASYNVLLRGLGAAGFDEAHVAAGLDTTGQFMNAIRADLDGDGDLDLFIGGFGQPVRIYRNQATGNHVLVELRGHLSNPQGLGAMVSMTAGALHRSYQMGDHFGPQIVETPIIDIGMGAAPRLDTLSIAWPSGYVQRLSAIAAGARLVVEEPPIVTIEPASRHLASGGVATVVVRPVDADGHPIKGAQVAIASPYHSTDWTGAAQAMPDGSTVRSLRAGAARSSVVVEVVIDGTALRVRPRIWFD